MPRGHQVSAGRCQTGGQLLGPNMLPHSQPAQQVPVGVRQVQEGRRGHGPIVRARWTARAGQSGRGSAEPGVSAGGRGPGPRRSTVLLDTPGALAVARITWFGTGGATWKATLLRVCSPRPESPPGKAAACSTAQRRSSAASLPIRSGPRSAPRSAVLNAGWLARAYVAALLGRLGSGRPLMIVVYVPSATSRVVSGTQTTIISHRPPPDLP